MATARLIAFRSNAQEINTPATQSPKKLIRIKLDAELLKGIESMAHDLGRQFPEMLAVALKFAVRAHKLGNGPDTQTGLYKLGAIGVRHG